MKLIVISPSKTIDDETKIVTSLFEHGLKTFHLRKPAMRTRDLRHFINSIPAHFHNRIVIHNHHSLMADFKLGGVNLARHHLHYSPRNWIRIQFIRFRNRNGSISTTFHKLGSLYENKRTLDYVLLGTIFDPVSGKFNAGYSEHSLRAALEKIKTPVIARGGTSFENIQICRDLGFSGIAYSSAVWKKPDPLSAFCEIANRYRELNIPVE
ncbi:MAG TPA: thiamine phosphate synthase [Bacteroidia bacterium]|nr:thiamine phosphate synthase [Bacteroidia bacterium]